jgi:integrase
MASIRQRGGRWQARITRLGYLPETKTFDSYDTAVKWSRAIETQIDRGAFVSLKDAERTTLGNALLRYAEEVSPMKRSATRDIAKLEWLARQKVAKHSLANLTPQAIAQFRDERMRKVSNGTVLRDLSTIRAVLNHARREWGFGISNPVEAIRKPPAPPPRDRILTEDEEKRLLNALTPKQARGDRGQFATCTVVPWVKPAVILALETAMRRGELLSLQWKNIDLVRRTAHLPMTKNGTARTVPLSPRAVQTLEALPRSIDGRVFPINYWTLEAVFSRARKTAGLADFVFHSLRHTAATRLAGKLANVLELSAVTGHKSLNMLKRYYHPQAETLAKKLA